MMTQLEAPRTRHEAGLRIDTTRLEQKLLDSFQPFIAQPQVLLADEALFHAQLRYHECPPGFLDPQLRSPLL